MLGCIRKVYKYFRSNRKKIQNMCEEINILKEEIVKLREDNLNIKMLISSQHNVISNPCYFAEDEHMYEEIKVDEITLLKSVINDVSPQLPPRNKINSIKL